MLTTPCFYPRAPPSVGFWRLVGMHQFSGFIFGETVFRSNGFKGDSICPSKQNNMFYFSSRKFSGQFHTLSLEFAGKAAAFRRCDTALRASTRKDTGAIFNEVEVLVGTSG